MLDRERPLWELWFVEGLEGGNVAIIQKTHHALIDGVSGVDVATLLLDMDPNPAVPVVPDWTPEPAPSSVQLLIDTLHERLTEPAEMVRSLRHALRGPRRALERDVPARRVDEHDGLARFDRAEHVAQRTHGPASAAVGGANSPSTT